MPLLSVTNVTKRFGGVTAVKNVSLDIEKGEIVGLIGPNGSGKTTFLNIINGFLKPDVGSIYFKGELINDLSPYVIARRGIGRTFQISRVFRRMSVLENMLAAMPESSKKEKMMKKAYELLEFVNLMDLRDEHAENLSGGQKKLLELARALMPATEFILLDEPVAGVNPKMIDDILGLTRDLRDRGITFLMVEHNMSVVMGFCERVIVFDEGVKIADGTPGEIQKDERVIMAYLGASE